MGLVAQVFDGDDAEGQARQYAEDLAAGAVVAIAAIKRCVHEGGQLPLEEGLALEASQMQMLFATKDAVEGLQAFVDKRPAEFVGA